MLISRSAPGDTQIEGRHMFSHYWEYTSLADKMSQLKKRAPTNSVYIIITEFNE